MANERELSLKITGDSSQAERAVARLEQALAKAEKELEKAKKTTDELDDEVDDLGGRSDKTGGRLDAFKARLSSFGDRAGDVAKDKLGPLGDVAGKAGVDLDGMSAKTLAAGAALTGLATFVAGGVVKLREMTAEVRQYKDAAALGWEEASRFAAVFKDFGVEADDGIDALKTLAEEAGDAPEKFERFNIEMSRSTDGSIDLTQTLKNTAERFKEIRDPAERAALGAALFGDNWLRIAPLLERGSDGLAKLIDNVDESRIVTEEAANEQAAMDQSMRNLGTAVDELQMSMAQGLVPALSQTARGIARVIEDLERMGQRVGWLDGLLSSSSAKEIDQFNEFLRMGGKVEAGSLAVTKAKALMSGASSAAAAAEQALVDVEEEAAHQLRILERNTKDAASAAKEMADRAREQRSELDKLNGVVLTAAGSTVAYERAVLANRDAQAALADKQTAATEALAAFGEEAPEAVAAQHDYEKAVLDAKNAALSQADAAVAQAEKLALASDKTFTAEQKNIVFKQSLEGVRDATNDPNLRAGLDGLIQITGDAAATAGDAARQYEAAEAAASRLAALAAGVNTTGAGEIIGSADSIERRLANQRGGSTSAAAAATPPAPSVVNVQVTSYGTNARDLEGLVTEQLIQQRMERGG